MAAATTEQSRVSNFGGDFQTNHDQWLGNTISNLHYHATPRSPSTAPKASGLIPFRRDRDFVERNVLPVVLEKCAEPAALVALVGLGGAGKSQLAIECAYRVREAHPDVWVFWVHASNLARFDESYRDIARLLQIPGANDPKADVLRLVKSYLSNEANGKWFMIVDNADDASVVLQAPEGRLALVDYLPTSQNGSILVTSRNGEVARGMIEYEEDILPVSQMTYDEAMTLVQRRLNKNILTEQFEDVKKLVGQLDYMPLAITQAVAYINQRAPLITVTKYLQNLNASEGDRNRLLSCHLRDPRRDRGQSNSILLTWHMTLAHLQRDHPTCIRLFALMCMFDREAIPAQQLRNQYMEEESAQLAIFEDDIATLRGFDLISTCEKEDTTGSAEAVFEMHRLVQSSMKLWLELNQELRAWETRFVNVLHKVYPYAYFEHWKECARLLPHVIATMKFEERDDPNFLPSWAEIVCRAGRYLLEIGQYSRADVMLRKSLVAMQKCFGEDDWRLLAPMNELSYLLSLQGKYREADVMFEDTLALSEKVLPPEDPWRLKVKNDLAAHLLNRGKNARSEQMLREVLAVQEQKFGKGHPETLITMHNLANSLYTQGYYEVSEEMCRQTLEGYKTTRGDDHPETLQLMSILTVVLDKQRRHKEAYDIAVIAYEHSKTSFGPNHPETLRFKHNVAMYLYNQGTTEEAEALFREVLADYERVLGKDHHSTLVTVLALATVVHNAANFDEATELYERACYGFETQCGEDHGDTLMSRRYYNKMKADMAGMSEDEYAAQQNADVEGDDDYMLVNSSQHPSPPESAQDTANRSPPPMLDSDTEEDAHVSNSDQDIYVHSPTADP